MSQYNPNEIFAAWQRRCEVNPQLGWENGTTVQVLVSGAEGGNWVCDLRKPPRVYRAREHCAAEVWCDAATLHDLASSSVSLLELFQEERIQGTGDQDTLTRFGLFVAELGAIHSP